MAANDSLNPFVSSFVIRICFRLRTSTFEFYNSHLRQLHPDRIKTTPRRTVHIHTHISTETHHAGLIRRSRRCRCETCPCPRISHSLTKTDFIRHVRTPIKINPYSRVRPGGQYRRAHLKRPTWYMDRERVI